MSSIAVEGRSVAVGMVSRMLPPCQGGWRCGQYLPARPMRRDHRAGPFRLLNLYASYRFCIEKCPFYAGFLRR
jgi:hypothetical protein